MKIRNSSNSQHSVNLKNKSALLGWTFELILFHRHYWQKGKVALLRAIPLFFTSRYCIRLTIAFLSPNAQGKWVLNSIILHETNAIDLFNKIIWLIILGPLFLILFTPFSTENIHLVLLTPLIFLLPHLILTFIPNKLNENHEPVIP